MVQENNNRLIINDVLKLCADISALYLNKKLSDVVLLVDNEKLYAHKTILAARSEYFEKIFVDDESVSEHVFTGIAADTLKKILKYIYSGTITLESSNVRSDLEMIGLASQYYLEDLKAPLIAKSIKLIDSKNVFSILDIANLYNLYDLVDACHKFLDINAGELKLSDGFNNLSQTSLINLLQRDTFILPETDIFNIVVNWRKFNTDLDDLVLNCVRLPWMSIVDIVSKVWPLKIIPCEKVVNAISEIVEVKSKTFKRRAQAELDVNVATAKYKSEVISGRKTTTLLTGNRDVNKYCYHSIAATDKTGITIKLGSVFVINNISLQLYDSDSRYYKYQIEASIDKKTWTKFLDYSMYPCRSVQNLYFEPVIAKYIRIIGTYNSSNGNFRVVYFETYYRSILPKLINNIVLPKTNVALLEKKAVVVEGNDGKNLINGDIKKTSYAYHGIGSGSIIIELAQPYMISSMRLRLWDQDSRFYKFCVETSTNKKDWKMAIDRRNQECKSWQEATFSERVTVFIKITGTHNSANDSFHCIHFECPSSTTSY